MKKGMLDIWEELRRRRLRTRLILQVHDELVFEVPAGEEEAVEELAREKMESVCPFRVPLKVQLGWGKSWAEAK
jgi:DNA polymerase-1